MLAESGELAGLVGEVAYVSGEMDTESSFTPGAFAALERWRDEYRIVGVFAMEEMLVEPAGLVCDVLGLPSPGLRASRVCRSKYLQRSYIHGYRPRSLTIAPGTRGAVELDAVHYPAVLKPAARHASSGVIACATADEVARSLSDYPAHETLLLEHQIDGPEFSVESLVQDGRIVFASVTEKRTTEGGSRSFVELCHTVPAGDVRVGGTGVVEAVLDANRDVLEALDYQDGITHSEWRVTEDGEVYLMEIASRTPGDGITLLYALACGEPLEPQVIRIALGERAELAAPRRYARQVYLDHAPGVLRDVVVDWPGVQPTWVGPTQMWPTLPPGAPGDPATLRGVLVLAERGTELRKLRSSDDRVVTFFLDADTPAELDELESVVRRAVHIIAEPAHSDRVLETVPC
ncbi:acetyl-CoA carboxylase biotin carboxylase subunit family protein [Cellulomonas sp. KH9]|uniref:ATP-grasp domain-containing protein n=1 Tax=Cellulomonas sp. KH9 TaxID=1855324 RepID=UPI0008E38F9C|nr:ATP-grasp domain-containing protein [Cellulomonas sp. KH9]SFK48134.1 ATP-grasp domain-containing protein [Cellulomonas sp. KH9]